MENTLVVTKVLEQLEKINDMISSDTQCTEEYPNDREKRGEESSAEKLKMIFQRIIPDLQEEADRGKKRKGVEEFKKFLNTIIVYSDEICSHMKITVNEESDYSDEIIKNAEEQVRNLTIFLDTLKGGVISAAINYINSVREFDQSYEYESAIDGNMEGMIEVTNQIIGELKEKIREEKMKAMERKFTAICRALVEHAEEICEIINISEIGM